MQFRVRNTTCYAWRAFATGGDAALPFNLLHSRLRTAVPARLQGTLGCALRQVAETHNIDYSLFSDNLDRQEDRLA